MPEQPYPGKLAAEVARLSAHSSLWELACRYAAALDGDDYEALAACFTGSAEFVGMAGPPARGTEAILTYVRQRIAVGQSHRVHVPTNQLIDRLGPETASGRVHCFAILTSGDGTQRVLSLRYADDYALEGGRWLFARRRIHDAVEVSTAG